MVYHSTTICLLRIDHQHRTVADEVNKDLRYGHFALFNTLYKHHTCYSYIYHWLSRNSMFHTEVRRSSILLAYYNNSSAILTLILYDNIKFNQGPYDESRSDRKSKSGKFMYPDMFFI